MKTAYVALIRDISKGVTHLESLPTLFDSEESVREYAKHRLNIRVTIVVCIYSVEVEDEVKLVSWV